ncbi:MAG: ROK family protein [Vicinamibacterales bacterium]
MPTEPPQGPGPRLRIGIDLGGTKIEGVLLQGGQELARLRVDTPRDDYDATLDAVAALVRRLERTIEPAGHTPSDAASGGRPHAPSSALVPEAAVPASAVPPSALPPSALPASAVPISVVPASGVPVGLGMPGTLDPAGLVMNANSAWLIGRPLPRDLGARLGRPVRVANDANCFAVSEATDGAAAGAEVVFGVILGTGVGGGIVVHGRPLVGRHGIAGEWGHNPLPGAMGVEVPGPSCYCGRRGCIEAFLSGPALSADHAGATGELLSPPHIVAAAANGDRAARRTMARYAQRLARALASVINLLDPDVIVLGGGLSNIELLYEDVPRLWLPHVFACMAPAAGVGVPRTAGPAGAAGETAAPVTTSVGGAFTPRVTTPVGTPVGTTVGTPVTTRLVRARHGDSSGVRGAAWLWPDDSHHAQQEVS